MKIEKYLLKESPESDLRMMEYQIQSALKKYRVNLERYSEKLDKREYNFISFELDKMEDSINKLLIKRS